MTHVTSAALLLISLCFLGTREAFHWTPLVICAGRKLLWFVATEARWEHVLLVCSGDDNIHSMTSTWQQWKAERRRAQAPQSAIDPLQDQKEKISMENPAAPNISYWLLTVNTHTAEIWCTLQLLPLLFSFTVKLKISLSCLHQYSTCIYNTPDD